MHLGFIQLNFLTFSEDPVCYLNMQSVSDWTGRGEFYEELNGMEWLGMITQQEITCIWLVIQAFLCFCLSDQEPENPSTWVGLTGDSDHCF